MNKIYKTRRKLKPSWMLEIIAREEIPQEGTGGNKRRLEELVGFLECLKGGLEGGDYEGIVKSVTSRGENKRTYVRRVM